MIMIRTKAIKTWIRLAGYPTQVKFAQDVGMSKDRLNRIINNRTAGLSLATVDRFCNVLGCQPGDILIHQPSPPAKPSPPLSS